MKHFSNSTHTCSLARPASGQQHYVTTSTYYADEWLQQCPPADGGPAVDQHADDAQHDQGHPFIHSQKTCRNALHTANYCTICPQERGSAKIWKENTFITAYTCKVGGKKKIQNAIRNPNPWQIKWLHNLNVDLHVYTSSVFQIWILATNISDQSEAVSISCWLALWSILSLHSPSPSAGPRSRSNTGETTKSPLKSGSGLGLCLRVCTCVFVFANWGHENRGLAIATHPCGGGCFSVVLSRFPPPTLSSSGQEEYSQSPIGSLEECQISRETMYKVKAGSPLTTQLGLLHPVYWLCNAGEKA